MLRIARAYNETISDKQQLNASYFTKIATAHNFKHPPTMKKSTIAQLAHSRRLACLPFQRDRLKQEHQILLNVSFLTFLLASQLHNFFLWRNSLKCMLSYLHSSDSCNIVLRSFCQHNFPPTTLNASFLFRYLIRNAGFFLISELIIL